MKIPFLFAAFLCGAPLFVSVAPVVAQTASFLEGVKLPRGSERYPHDTAPFEGVLNGLAKDKDVRRTPTGEGVQVWIWRGDNYNAEKVSVLKMGLRGALTGAGFSVKNAENAGERVQMFDFFDANDTNAPFYPNPWNLPSYFWANNGATGTAFVGAWIQSNDALVLAMLPVTGEKKAAASASSVSRSAAPTVNGSAVVPLVNAIRVSDGDNAMRGVTSSAKVAFTSVTRKPGMVRGQIKDAAGHPIAGATVSVEAGALGGFRTQHTGRSNAQGVYEVAVPVGLCRVSAAWCQRAYNGTTYALPLQSADGNLEQFDNRRGHTENFVLRTWGATGHNGAPSDFKSYYVGSVRVSRSSSIQEGGTFELTLMPQGRLLDGSQGRPIVYRVANDSYEFQLHNIPLGRYKASVKLISDDVTAPVQVEKFPTNQVGSSVIIDFESVSPNQPDFGYCPVRQFHISLHP